MSASLSRNDSDRRSGSFNADETEIKSKMPPSNTMEKECCDLEEEVQYFRKFLNKVQNCLSGRSRLTGTYRYIIGFTAFTLQTIHTNIKVT